MQTKEIVSRTEAYAKEIAEKYFLEVVEAEYVKEGGEKYLRVYIDKDGGVSIDDCETLSRELEEILDREDFIDEAYILEVSSPGLDRILKKDSEYTKYKGRQVLIKLYKPINKIKEFEGELVGLKENNIVIKTDEGEKSFPREGVAFCRLCVVL